MHRTSTATAGRFGAHHFIADVAVAANACTIEPCEVKELAGLHMEADGNGVGGADGVGRRTATVSAAEILDHALAGDEDRAVITVPVTIVVAILRTERRRGQGTECNDKKNEEDGNEVRRSALARGSKFAIRY